MGENRDEYNGKRKDKGGVCPNSLERVEILSDFVSMMSDNGIIWQSNSFPLKKIL
jgi:hypothetical protein